MLLVFRYGRVVRLLLKVRTVMKISIAKTTVNHFATRMAKLGVVLHREVLEQDGIKLDDKGLLNDLPFFGNIKDYMDKTVTISKTESTVDIVINEQFLQEYMDIAFNLYERVAKHAVGLAAESKRFMVEMTDFDSKWSPVSSPEPEGVSNEPVPTEPTIEVEFETSQFDHLINGWKLTKGSVYRDVLQADLETTVRYHYYDAVRINNGQEIQISSGTTQSIVESDKTLQDTAKQVGMPITLVKAIREVYNVLPLVDADTITTE